MYRSVKVVIFLAGVLGVCWGQERNVLIEYFTDVECSACPRGGVEIKRLMKKYPGRLISLAYHFNDVMTTPLHREYKNYEKVMGMPSLDCNRRGKFYVPAQPATGIIEDSLHVDAVSGASIDLDISLSESKELITGAVTLSLAPDESGDSLYLQLFIVEDSVNGGEGYAQKNLYAGGSTGQWPTLEAQSDVIADYPHRWVVRDHLLGEGLLGVEVDFNGSNSVTKEIAYTIPQTYNGLVPEFSNLSLVAVFSLEPGEVLQVVSKSLSECPVSLISTSTLHKRSSLRLIGGVLHSDKNYSNVRILSLNGRVITSLSQDGTSMNLKELSLSKGVYIIEVQGHWGIETIEWNNY